MTRENHSGAGRPGGDEGRRDFLRLATGTLAAVGGGAALWPFIDSMNPAADVLADSSVDVDLEPITEGQRIEVAWRGHSVFITRRKAEEIARAKADDAAELIDPALDGERARRAEWLIVVGVCTHLGCTPLGQKARDTKGAYGGWLCSCHGSVYDTSGRVRRGPAPKNLAVPRYVFLDGGIVRIG